MAISKNHIGPFVNIDPELIIGTREAARLLGVGEREVRYKIQRKTLPAVKIGNRYCINSRAPHFYLKAYKGFRERLTINCDSLDHNSAVG